MSNIEASLTAVDVNGYRAKMEAEEAFYKERNKMTPEQERQAVITFLATQLTSVGHANMLCGPYDRGPESVAKVAAEIKDFIASKLKEYL
jgi:hypothetical protein